MWETVSTLKLNASRDDHGKTLTCTAQTIEEENSDHVTLKVKSKLQGFWFIFVLCIHISHEHNELILKYILLTVHTTLFIF